MKKELFLTDKEVADILRVSPRTLCSIVSGFVRGGNTSKRTYGKIIDMSKAEPGSMGGFRRWNVGKLALALGVDVKAIYERLERRV